MFHRFSLAFAAIAFCATTCAGQALAVWDFEPANQLGGTATGAFVNAEDASQGAAVLGGFLLPSPSGGAAGDALSGAGFPSSVTRDADAYFQVEIFCPAGDCDVTSISALYEADVDGPTAVYIAYATSIFGPYTDVTPAPLPLTPGSNAVNLPLAAPVLSAQDLFVRVYPVGASNTFANFYLGGISIDGSQSAAPLPLEFTSITARAEGRDITVDWTTADQFEVSHFEIYLSTSSADALQAVQRIDGFADTYGDHSYSARIHSTDVGTAYVQVVAVDVDGSRTVSELVTVDLNAAAGEQLRVINRGGGRYEVTGLAAATPSAQPHVLRLMAADGRLLQSYAPVIGEASIFIDTRGFGPGVHYLNSGTQTVSLPLIR